MFVLNCWVGDASMTQQRIYSAKYKGKGKAIPVTGNEGP
jgi:hypothetical protein